jgi:hypothetical protein
MPESPHALNQQRTHKGIKKLFLCDSNGRLVSRRPDVWSANWDCCQDCGTTERPHESRGLCRNCFAKWRWKTNHNGYRDKQLATAKRRRIRTEYQEQYDAKRKDDPKRRKQRREISRRWSQKHAKYAVGTVVEYEFIPGHLIKGTVVENQRMKALVRFATFEELIVKYRLHVIQDSQP